MHYTCGCVLKEAVHPLHVEIDSLKQENDILRASAGDCGYLQTVVTDLEAKLKDAQQKLKEQTSLVCFVFQLI